MSNEWTLASRWEGLTFDRASTLLHSLSDQGIEADIWVPADAPSESRSSWVVAAERDPWAEQVGLRE